MSVFAKNHQCTALLPSCGHSGKRLNADLRELGSAVWDTEFHAVSGCPIEVLLQAQCYHIMWEGLLMYSSARRAIYLFAIFFTLSQVRKKRSSTEKSGCFQILG
ncbi:hypothetical protein XENOCAPTIV_024266 [Xenoophorus captivus]|uniref:Uncharacterized protein n=1 Tax=Xenoophorus captivus TaxID=1517983 RepID=A0ABV0QNN4_9TELE